MKTIGICRIYPESEEREKKEKGHKNKVGIQQRTSI